MSLSAPAGRSSGPAADLRRLAAAYGVQVRYRDALHRWRAPSEEALVAVLRALGADVTGAGDAAGALAERERARADRLVEPVLVARAGRPSRHFMSLDPTAARGAVQFSLEKEDGDVSEWSAAITEAGPRFALPSLPVGYHRLRATVGGRTEDVLVIAAPERCTPFDERIWGVFAPLYALGASTSGDQGIGDLEDLRRLMIRTAMVGGRIIATLPLFATFTGPNEPFEPSPYAPVSRLFWNELFLDIRSLPKPGITPRSLSGLVHRVWRQTAEHPEMVNMVDYRRVTGAVHAVLDHAAHLLVSEPSDLRHEFEQWCESRPDAVSYARFRASVERTGTGWRAWPERTRKGLRASDVEPAVELRHLYAQWTFERRLHELVAMGRHLPEGLHVDLAFDLPLGVHPDGFDAWRERAVMVEGANAGAPPDRLFTKGQDWGFAPLHPDRVREDGYRYPIACLRSLMSRARFLRLDHVMGLHRLFFVPHGTVATAGTYVRYRPEEWYAILAIESQRSGCVVVGEDLGTVPRAVRHAMRRHGVLRSYVTELELWPGNDPPLAEPPRASVASLNTHDLAPFAGYLKGRDIDDRRRIGLFDDDAARRAHAERRRLVERFVRFLHRRGLLDEPNGVKSDAIFRSALAFLGSSDAALVTVSLDDLLGEVEPQNIPGTGPEEPNWRRRAAGMPGEPFEPWTGTLRMLNDLRPADRSPAVPTRFPTP
jgi:4-alpha-glucanotransferase